MSGNRQGCVLTSVPWVRTARGPATLREALAESRHIVSLDPTLNGIETGATLRFITAVAALVVRYQGGAREAFDPAAVDAVIAELSPATDLYDADRPFLQVPAHGGVPDVSPETRPKKLYPWMPAHRAEEFWSTNVQATVLEPAAAALALVVHYHYSFGGNNRLEARACVNGSPGIRYPGVGYTATEVLWQGVDLAETILMNTPKAWVEGTGLPAWADPGCTVSHPAQDQPEHPLWRATWGSNTALCRWEDGCLTAVSIGGSAHMPPTMSPGKEGAKAWWDTRNTEDSFYLYVDVEKRNAKGVVLGSERKAQRLDLGHADTDLAVEWNAKNLSVSMHSRSKGTVKTPGRESQVMFLRHLVEGSASSPVVRRTQVMISSPKKWMVDEDRADAVSDASAMLKSVCSELCKPFTTNGRLTALRDRRTDIETVFWHRVSVPFEDFIINGTGEHVDPAVWPLIRAAALEAFDEITASSPMAKLAPVIMMARNRVAWHTAVILGLTGTRAAAPETGAAV